MLIHPVDADLIIFDVDGTLRQCTVAGQPCPNQPHEWMLADNVRSTLAAYAFLDPESARCLAVASNQAGVAYGYIMSGLARMMIQETVATAMAMPGDFASLKYQMADRLSLWICESADKSHPMRKPNPGMLMQAMNFHDIMPDRTAMIGDMESDRMAAANAGVAYYDAGVFFGW